MIIFPEHTHLQVEQIDLHETLTVVISSTEARAVCTYCGTTATHIHSRYHRRLSDLPVSGYPVKLLVQVRRFFCQNPSCSRKTFAEALLPLARRYAQRTNRLQTTLQHQGLALGAEAGARAVPILDWHPALPVCCACSVQSNCLSPQHQSRALA